jgi:hypothetical protein
MSAEHQSTGWQPIETAPKDGRRVLLFCPAQHHVTIGSWQVNPYEDHRMAWSTDEGESVALTHDHPTKWQPLPVGPQA